MSMGQQSDMGGVPGSHPNQVPEDYLPGDERPGQRSLTLALQQLALSRRRSSLHNFLNVLGERSDTGTPAVQGEVS